MRINKIAYILFALTTIVSADIQKNHTVQIAIRKHEVGKEDTHYTYDFSSLFNTVTGFKTAIDIFHDRYKDQKINGYIALTASSFSIATTLGYLHSLPVYLAEKMPDLDPDGYYVMIGDVIKTSQKIQQIIESIQKQKCHVVEVACLTELPQLNGRNKINAQVFSIFIERFKK